MSNLSVIIPSKTFANALACVFAVRNREPNARIILVDDGIVFSNAEIEQFIRTEATVVPGGEKPFIFSRNVNIGINAAGADDVVIMNDDAILKTPGGLSLIQEVSKYRPDFGVIAATTNCVGNRNQLPQNIGLREDPRMVCFVCVFIPRRTIDAIGLLDERFVHYGCEDDDYCLRIRNAGLKIGIHDGCFVDHSSLPSSFRGAAGAGGDYRPNLEIFKQKWGMDNHGNAA